MTRMHSAYAHDTLVASHVPNADAEATTSAIPILRVGTVLASAVACNTATVTNVR